MRTFVIMLLGFSLFMLSCVKQEKEEKEMQKPSSIFRYANIELDVPSSWKETISENLVEFVKNNNNERNKNLHIIGSSFGSVQISFEKLEQLYTENIKKRFANIKKVNRSVVLDDIVLLHLEGDFYKRPNPTSKSFTLLKNHGVLSILIPTSNDVLNFWLDTSASEVNNELETIQEFLGTYRKTAGNYHLQTIARDEIITATVQGLETKPQAEPSNTRILEGNRFDFSLFSLKIPDTWIYSKPKSNMRLAEFILRDFSEYSVVAFNFGQVDFDHKRMIEENITRWRGQFTKLEEEERLSLENDNFALVYLSGTYKKSSTMGGSDEEMENYAALNGIVPTSQGPYYFRLEAPKNIIQKQKHEFQDFLNSYSEQKFAREINDEEEVNPEVGLLEENKFNFTLFTLKIPTDWNYTKPTNDMRIAEFTVNNDNDANVVAYSFGQVDLGYQEMVESNINRWRTQFTKVEEEERISLDYDNLTLVYLAGKFIKKRFPMDQEGQEVENYATLNGIVSTDKGPYYFRLEAPKDTILKQKENFKNFLNSYEKFIPKEKPDKIENSQKEASLFNFSLFALQVPKDWSHTQPKNQMRLAEFIINKSPQYSVIAFFFGQVDLEHNEMVQSNINRWRGQFTQVRKEELLPLDNENFTLIYLSGDDYATLSAIVPTAEGPYYFQLKAPEEIVLSQKENFQYFINSCKNRESMIPHKINEEMDQINREIVDEIEEIDEEVDEEVDEEIAQLNREIDEEIAQEIQKYFVKFGIELHEGEQILTLNGEARFIVPFSWKPFTLDMENVLIASYFSEEYAVMIYRYGETSFPDIFEGNIKLWKDEFSNIDKEEKLDISTPNAIAFYLSGKYLDSIDGDISDYATINAIINFPSGDPYFLRIEGPRDLVDEQLEAFKNFMNSCEIIK